MRSLMIFVVLLMSTSLFSQFLHVVTIDKDSTEDIFVEQQIFDALPDLPGEEICLGTEKPGITGSWEIAFYDSTGSYRGEITGVNPPRGPYFAKAFKKFRFLTFENETYLMLLFSAYQDIIHLRLYRYPGMQLISEVVNSNVPRGNSFVPYEFELFDVVEANPMIVALGVSARIHQSSSSTTTLSIKQQIMLFSLENDTLRFAKVFPDYYAYFPESGLAFGERSGHSIHSNSEPETRHRTYNLGIGVFNNTSPNIFPFKIWTGYFVAYQGFDHYPSQLSYLTRTNDHIATYAHAFYYQEQDSLWQTNIFLGYDSSFINILWERNDTNLDLTDGITVASSFPVNGSEEFMIYFVGKNYEIRDMLTGSIVANDSTEFAPQKILIDDAGSRYLFSKDSLSIKIYVTRQSLVTSVSPTRIAKGFALKPNYPNPFNPTTTIEFKLPVASRVTLEIFNVMGQRIARAHRDTPLRAGAHTYVWDATDDSGNLVASGVYFYRLTAGDFQQVRKMLLVR